MKSVRDVYIIGNGPSSSHTMGPSFAIDYVLNKYPNLDKIEVILCGSLAFTGKGHLTDKIIDEKLSNVNHKITFDYKRKVEHPNTLFLKIYQNNEIFEEKVLSIGGGSILTNDNENESTKEVYHEHYLSDILKYCDFHNLTLFQYIIKNENKDLLSYLTRVYETMENAIANGISKSGYLPGSLKVKRKAKEMFERRTSSLFEEIEIKVTTAAFAVSEENASGGIVVTAPTCGSSGVIPGVITYLKYKGISKDKIIEGLAVAGLIGVIVKTNASISGAVSGCQAEIGVASAMASALIMHAFGYDNYKIAQASEIALEHSLGLTCDPIKGYVQIPCIERNAIFALKAINSASLASFISSNSNKITFDDIVKTMYETGNDIKKGYKETSKKGMSKLKI